MKKELTAEKIQDRADSFARKAEGDFRSKFQVNLDENKPESAFWRAWTAPSSEAYLEKRYGYDRWDQAYGLFHELYSKRGEPESYFNEGGTRLQLTNADPSIPRYCGTSLESYYLTLRERAQAIEQLNARLAGKTKAGESVQSR